jgi:hypothetical protein
MRFLWVLSLGFTAGCASTVTRLDGEFKTPAGPARTACEKNDWLVVAPTRAELQDSKGRPTDVRDDGVGIYRVGATKPESIPSLADELGSDSESFARHGNTVRPHDTKQLIASALGGAGLVAIAVGTVLFVTAFGNERRGSDQEQTIDSTQAVLGGVFVGVGFGLGIGGLSVNPGQAERSHAEAARYVFLPPEDSREEVTTTVGKYNQRVRERCPARP